MGPSLANGRFEVLRLLGEGGMGVVHAARDCDRNEVVALKSLRHLGGEALLRFKREFRALQDLHHPNLVSLGELVEDGDDWFYTMELIEGVDVLTWIGDDRERLRDALRQLAAGLGALHAAGKVHRDIKPSNVLVTGDGRVVLVDFGLVAELTEMRAPHGSDLSIVGTAAYMAPEQAASRPVGPASDWYSVGCLVYESLTGRLPFDGTTIEVLMQKIDSEPEPASSFVSVPADLDALCRDLLRTDPEKRPRAEDVLRRLRGELPRASGTAPPVHGTMPPGGSVFVGRELEMAALAQAFEDADSRPVCVLVHGESGVGKSALVRSFVHATMARRDDVVVLDGRCYERETVRYKTVDGVIDALSRHLSHKPKAEVEELVPPHADVLVQVFPVLGRVNALAAAERDQDPPDPAERRRRLLGALRELFTRLARRNRVVITIDDLQWADADGLAALRELCRPGVLVIATGRTATSDRGAMRDVRAMRLGPLTETSTRELAQTLAAAAGLDSVDTEALAAEAAGHPLFLDELIRRTAEHGSAAGVERLDDTVRARVARLPDDARHILTLLSVAGAPLAHEILARAADVELPVYLKSLDVLRHERLARSGGTRRGDPAEAAHDRVATAIRGALDPDKQRALHLRLALALAAEPHADAEALAVHWAGAGEPGRAAIHARVAADRATAELAFERAARLYMQVLEHGGGEDDPQLYVRLADALVGAGRGAEAAGSYLAAAQLSPPDLRVRFELEAADQMLRSAHIDEGLSVLQRVLPGLGLQYPLTPTRALMSLAWRRARVRLRGIDFKERDERDLPPEVTHRIDACWMIGLGHAVLDPIRGFDFMARHLLLALDAGEPRRIARGLAQEAAFAATGGKPNNDRVEKLLARAGELAARHNDPYSRAWTIACGGIAAWLNGRWREATQRCTAAEAELRAHCVGASWEITSVQLFDFRARVQLGDLDGLDARLDQLLADSRNRGDLLAPSQLLGGHTHVMALAQDEPDRARRDSAEWVARYSRGGYRIPNAFDLWAMTQTDLYTGDAAAAWRRVQTGWRDLESSRLLRVELIRLYCVPSRGRAAVAAALAGIDTEAATRMAQQCAAALEHEPAGWARPWATVLRAGLAAIAGDHAERARLLAVAADGFAAHDMALCAAAAHLRRGQCLGGKEGDAIAAAAAAEMTARVVKVPERFAAMIAP